MAVERILKNVPENKVDKLVKGFESEGCTVTKVKQRNGKWTIRATCPEK